MNIVEDKIKQLARKHINKMQEIRRHLHKYPELSTQEYQTAAYIKSILDELEIEYHTLADTGIVALIKGKTDGKTVLLRGDMDALPIQEAATVDYKSVNDGIMHACGHDGHVAGLLGAAMILNEVKDQLSGNVKLMFQPAEENQGGAERMIEQGILENPRVDAAFGLHLWGEMEENTIGIKSGEMMAAPDFFTFKIVGRGGHAALPHETIDPINLCMQAVNNMQNIVSRRIDPVDPIVLSFCSIHAGMAANVIPGEIEVKGTIRTLSAKARQQIPEMMERTLRSICEEYGATYVFEYQPRYPALINDEAMTCLVEKAVTKVVGADRVLKMEKPNMGGEDFAYLGYKVPAAFYFYGIAPPDGSRQVIHHHPAFEWDDRVLEGSSATLALIACEYLSAK